jgi:hypothetical protein
MGLLALEKFSVSPLGFGGRVFYLTPVSGFEITFLAGSQILHPSRN